ncbi:MAG: transporter substrate-binding domain-containing protein [Lentisphaeria bacterium]|nr:transporter substrate-binding domain-containing protein [Lentisphaeria bacterium]
MNSVIAKWKLSGMPVFWLAVILLIAVAGTCSIVGPVHYARAKKRVEPEVAIHPINAFEKTLRVVGDVDYKPFSYIHHNESEPHGYDVELVSELANRMGVNLDLQLIEWQDAVNRMQKREADLIIGCDWQDASVMECRFTIPTFEEKFVAFELEPSDSFSDLYKKKIAVIEGCGLKDTLMHYQLWPNCKEYDAVTDCVQAVLDGECDCFIAHHTIGEVSLQTLGKDGKRFRGRMDIASGQMCFGIAADDPGLFEKVNETLLAMRADGTMDDLAGKWLERFDVDVTMVEYMRKHPFILFLIADLLLAVVVVFLVMNHFLIKIRKEKDRAIAAERSKSFFFSTVSHDIRTPLNAIIGFSELLKNGIEDKEERKQALNAITTSGQTLLDLINDVLDLSKLDAGKIIFSSELTDFNRLASGVMHSFDVSVSGGDVKLEEDVPPIPFLYIDPHRIRQILFNLIGNAVKFTEHGKIVLSASFVENSAHDETGCLTFSVSDTGCGIAEEDQENILKPFVQAKSSKAVMGTGLGLSICCQLAERMGGKLSLKSVPGQGATFTVTFPNVRFSTKEKPVETTGRIQLQPAQDGAPAEPKKTPRILIVDDVAVNMKVIQSMLRRLGMTDVITAGNGAEALDVLQNDETVEIVLTDMWMPVMNGEELIREIRQREQWKDLRVYAVTADVETQKTYKDSGFTGILLKPIRLSQLQSIIG